MARSLAARSASAYYELLLQRIHQHDLPESAFKWYLDLRKYGGVPHAGFGMGIERAVAWICGLEHVRETIPFAAHADSHLSLALASYEPNCNPQTAVANKAETANRPVVADNIVPKEDPHSGRAAGSWPIAPRR